MNIQNRNYIILFLAVSALLLASLIPGGPIENRDFSHIHVGVLGGFNIFLTMLNIGTFALIYWVRKQRRWALTAAWFAGLAYFFVYAIDLAQVFPQSPTPMSQALSLIEVLGICAAVPLMFLSWPYTPFASGSSHYRDFGADGEVREVTPMPTKKLHLVLIAFVIALGIGIILFATDSAINPAIKVANLNH